MRQIILQPVDETHYSHTIEASVPLSTITPHLNQEELAALRAEFPEGAVWVWGCKPGENDTNVRQWKKIQKGDIVLFTRKQQVIGRAEVKYKTDNERLALSLWPENDTAETWRYVYFVSDVTPLAIPIEDLNRWAGYQPDAIVYGVRVLDQEKSNSVLTHLGLLKPRMSEKEYIDVLKDLETLDTKREALARKEQTYLRDRLFGNVKNAQCGLCEKEFPVELLVAAHIKPRAKCSDAEKRDLHNVMPICAFGCDDLFERGYIWVSDGQIVGNPQKTPTVVVVEYVLLLVDSANIGIRQALSTLHGANRTADVSKKERNESDLQLCRQHSRRIQNHVRSGSLISSKGMLPYIGHRCGRGVASASGQVVT